MHFIQVKIPSRLIHSTMRNTTHSTSIQHIAYLTPRSFTESTLVHCFTNLCYMCAYVCPLVLSFVSQQVSPIAPRKWWMVYSVVKYPILLSTLHTSNEPSRCWWSWSFSESRNTSSRRCVWWPGCMGEILSPRISPCLDKVTTDGMTWHYRNQPPWQQSTISLLNSFVNHIVNHSHHDFAILGDYPRQTMEEALTAEELAAFKESGEQYRYATAITAIFFLNVSFASSQCSSSLDTITSHHRYNVLCCFCIYLSFHRAVRPGALWIR